MTEIKVTCIKKKDHQNPHERITQLGSGDRRWTQQQVIERIEAKTDSFYTLDNGIRADILVVNGPHGKYLRTYVDGKESNNLLDLPECNAPPVKL